jgi:integrase
LSPLVKLWEEDYRDKLKPSSRSSYNSIIKVIILPAIGTRLVKDLDYPTVKELHKKTSKDQPIGANRMITVLSRLMNIAEVEGWRPRATNPCLRFPKTKEISCSRVLSAVELARLEASMATLIAEGRLDQFAGDLFRFLAFSGLRIGEAKKLMWSNINLTRGTMTISDHKTFDSIGEKVLPLNPPLREILKRLSVLRLSAYIFPGLSRKGPIQGLRKMWLRVLDVKACKLDGVTPHDLRRTFKTTCTDLGYHDGTGEILLGHSLGKISGIYTHLSPDGLLFSASKDTALWIAAAMRGEKVKNGKKVNQNTASGLA